MKYVLDIVYSIVFLLLLPKLLFRRFTQNRYKDGWENRFGKVKKRTDKKTIWIHAVSVGEVNATRTIINSLKEAFPQYEIVLSTTTDTGFSRATQLYGKELSVFFFPMDFSFVMRRAFKRLDPAICLLMELEVWPNFTTIANESGAKVVVVNGRLSERSFPRYKLIRFATKWMFGKVTMFLSQSDEYSQRFKALGVANDKIINTGTLKYDTAELSDNIEGKDVLKKEISLDDGENLWVCGGTGPGEEEIILEVFSELRKDNATKDLRLAIVPRKPERFNDVAKLIVDAGFKLHRYSEIKGKSSLEIDKDAIILGDTMGDLRKFYALASCVFIGRSLTPMGGSDMMESTAMGKFTTFGPYTFNFKQTVEALLNGNGAVEIKDAKELFMQIDKAIQDPQYRNTIATNGQNVIKKNQGATKKTLDVISKLLETSC